jgi:hypothetical protein
MSLCVVLLNVIILRVKAPFGRKTEGEKSFFSSNSYPNLKLGFPSLWEPRLVKKSVKSYFKGSLKLCLSGELYLERFRWFLLSFLLQSFFLQFWNTLGFLFWCHDTSPKGTQRNNTQLNYDTQHTDSQNSIMTLDVMAFLTILSIVVFSLLMLEAE